MKTLNFFVLASAICLLCAFTIVDAMNWQVAENYSVAFKGTDAEGIFKTMTATVAFDESDLPSSNFAISVEVGSINTGNGMKNKHAKSDKWFDAEKYPNITFKSSKFSKSADGYIVQGTLDMHGVKKEITIPFTFDSNTFNSKFSVNRMDYGIGTMEGMSKKVSNQIDLEISVPVVKK